MSTLTCDVEGKCSNTVGTVVESDCRDIGILSSPRCLDDGQREGIGGEHTGGSVTHGADIGGGSACSHLHGDLCHLDVATLIGSKVPDGSGGAG